MATQTQILQILIEGQEVIKVELKEMKSGINNNGKRIDKLEKRVAKLELPANKN